MISKLSPYIAMGIPLLIVVATWRYSDWRNWKKYYPTVLFILTINFCSSVLTYDHPLWYLPKNLFLPNDTMRQFFMMFVGLSPMTLLYLSRYPYQSQMNKQLIYILCWIAAFWMIEGIFVLLKKTIYFNGWSYSWSFLLWCVMFPVLRIHHTRPLLAWLICVGFSLFVVSYFRIPITKLK